MQCHSPRVPRLFRSHLSSCTGCMSPSHHKHLGSFVYICAPTTYSRERAWWNSPSEGPGQGPVQTYVGTNIVWWPTVYQRGLDRSYKWMPNHAWSYLILEVPTTEPRHTLSWDVLRISVSMGVFVIVSDIMSLYWWRERSMIKIS